jgi:transposase InsO family protein
MKQQHLVAIQPRSFKPRTTQSRHPLGYSDNLLLDAEPPTSLNQVWVGDITYLPLKNGRFSYLALLMDLHSRRIIGWRHADHLGEELVLAALKLAIACRQPPPALIHHTDRGGQYAGHEYRAVLKRAAMRQSMSRPDNCYDNAFIESCFGTIKTELQICLYENLQTCCREIAEYIHYYNNQRRHSSLDYLTPREFEDLCCRQASKRR